MCNDLALMAAVYRASSMTRQRPGVALSIIMLLEREALDVADVAVLTGDTLGVITRVIGALRRVGVISGDNEIAERWREAKPARSAHAEAQARYRQRQKARKTANPEGVVAADHVISRVITRDQQVITADHRADHADNEPQKHEENRQIAEADRTPLRVFPDQEGKGSESINFSLPSDQGHASESEQEPGLTPAQARRMNWTNKLQLAAKRILPDDHHRELCKRLKQPELYGFIMRRAPLDAWVKTTFEVIDLRLKEEAQQAAELRAQPRLPLTIEGGKVSQPAVAAPVEMYDIEPLSAVGD